MPLRPTSGAPKSGRRRTRPSSATDARRFAAAERLRAAGRFAAAERRYAAVLAGEPRHLKALFGRAAALEALGRAGEAAPLRARARRVEAEDLATVGHAAAFHGRYPVALACYRRAVALDPALVEAAWGMAEVQGRRGRRAEAARWYRRILAIDPTNPEARHMLAALGADAAPARASDGYVTAYFDRFAEYFDRQLTEQLDYRVPALLRAAVGAARPPLKPGAAVLDLGCGTGLGGAAFGDLAGRLDGVDLSPAMVAKARERAVYDRLVVAEMIAHLAATRRRYDLAIAADALVYLGDLEPVLAGVVRVLRPGGLFAFTTEWRRGGGFALTKSGRYAHTRTTLRRWADRAGLTEAGARNATLRTEYARAVVGTVWLFRKS